MALLGELLALLSMDFISISSSVAASNSFAFSITSLAASMALWPAMFISAKSGSSS